MVFTQLSLFEEKPLSTKLPPLSKDSLDLGSFERILVAFSGGKDSIACFLSLLKGGVDPSRIELHHHLVDGREGSTLFDWACTEDYCRKFAEYFGVQIFFSWIEGGLERELLRQNAPKAPTWFETPDGLFRSGGRGDIGTRRRFPAKTGDLTKRWCSPYSKIDVLATSIRNQKRFLDGKTLIISGERAEESPKRSKYPGLEYHRTHCQKRHVEAYRPVHKLVIAEVWALLQEFSINAHPAYHLGWGRLSCRACIFGSPNQWASNEVVSPTDLNRLVELEKELKFTIDNKFSIPQMIAKGSPYSMEPEMIELATSRNYDAPIVLDKHRWVLPAGAFGEQNGSI
jgi:hypothetical protein